MGKKYVGVMHSWFQQSRGFELFDIEAKNLEEARMKADAKAHREYDTFDRTAATVVEIDAGHHRVVRSLTLKERLTGRITA